MGLIPDETIDQVLAATDIVGLVESYFPLRKRGVDHWAVCPFHAENTPSFKVSSTRQNFHCFGCGASGSAIRFVMDYENLDFPSAVKRLAARAGITVREEEPSPEERARSRLREQLVALHRAAAEWFHAQLIGRRGADADRARQYLRGREFNAEIAKRWQIGYAPDDNSFADWARGQGYSGRVMVASGLMAPRDEANLARGLYARFRDRIMFPINNDYGDTIAFSGRVLDPEAKTAKYVNSPETPLFNKSKVCFGLDRSRRAIAKAEAVIICEGQLDAIRCQEAGVENVVAPLGTAFTEHHARLLRRFAGERGEALLCFDSDEAGYKASARAYTELAAAGLFVRAVELPDGEDPDSLISKHGAGAFLDRVAAARPFYHHQIDRLAARLDIADPRSRIQFVGEVAPTVASIGDSVAREAVINDVATRLGIAATEFRKRVAAAAEEAERSAGRRGAGPPETRPASPPIDDPDARILLRLALTDDDTLRWVRSATAGPPTVFETLPGTAGELLTTLWNSPPNATDPATINAYLSRLSAEHSASLGRLLNGRFAPLQHADALRALRRMQIRVLEREREATLTQLRDPSLNKSQIIELTIKSESQRKELLDLKKALKNIAAPQD